MADPKFIDRVNNPQNYPYVTNPDGSISTHRMAAEYDEDSGQWMAFPMIQMQGEELKVYEDDQLRSAMDNAIRTGNFLTMPSKDAAIEYSKGGYKTDALNNFGEDMSMSGYGILDFFGDLPYSELHKFFTKGHQTYYGDAPNMIKELRPELSGPRVDRNLQDQMLNFIGGYDMAARGMSPEGARSGAKAYQGRQYMWNNLTGDDARRDDAIGDYQENVAGINAYNPEQGRLSDEALIDLALKFAEQRMGRK